MILHKHTHPTVVLHKERSSLLIDPGTFTPAAPRLVGETSAVLITHDHPDHFDVDLLSAALESQRELRIWAPADVVAQLHNDDGRVTVVAPGDRIDIDGFQVDVVGGTHAVIHPDMPETGNVGYVIDDDVYHPGDSYHVPGLPVKTLLVPTSGPWAKLDAAVDFIRAVQPDRAIQIHDMMLTAAGRQFFSQFVDPLTGIELLILEDGDAVQL
ncbi:MBL fold metallo-hydrolase [Cryobacterium algoricola]|uniref:MBL fold metallo-hydrolase n=1 Tax=Cryobacterium algoricola TaxID=1259183 RepID=A0ABY2I7E2_9MICO|nr:MBL fold metallo-hydrolase [Cryobacterium algoricola]TFB83611.1 MBL fold metallo-hydrolase [Cryobacterium algoricola]